MEKTTRRLVVVAEDDDELRELLVWALKREGLQVHEVEDGLELLDYINFVVGHGTPKGLPDLVLTDVLMPGSSGLDMIALARSRGLTCPFVVLTGFADDTVRARAVAIGQTQVLSKPQELDHIRDVVRQALAAA